MAQPARRLREAEAQLADLHLEEAAWLQAEAGGDAADADAGDDADERDEHGDQHACGRDAPTP